MIKVILSSFLVTLLYTPFGIFFYKGTDFRAYSLQLIFGLILISFFALTLNFFLPLNKLNNSTLILLSIIVIFINRDFFFRKKFIFFCLLSTGVIVLLISNSNVYRPDAGLYHLPYINLLNYEKIIIGNSNLHFRFGHTSIIQYLSAITNNFIFGVNGIVFPSALIASSILINFSSNLLKYINDKKLNYHFFFLFSVFVFIIYKMNRYGEYGNDAPAHFLLFLLVSEIIKNFESIKLKDISNYFILSIFVIMNKVTLITSILFPLIFLSHFKNFKILKSKRIIFLITFLLLWSFKNILVSGCLIYPIKITCLKNLSWTDIDSTNINAIENEAWAKGWPDFRDSNTQIKKKEFSSNFFWLDTWINNHFFVILKILVPYIFFLIIILFFIKGDTNYYKKNNYFKFLYVICIFGILIWFYKVPNFRYGYSNIIILISLLFATISFRNCNLNYFSRYRYIILILLTIFSLKNLNRIIFEDKKYFNYPWPKFYSYNKENNIQFHKFKIINNKKIYFPENGYCMYSQAPCGEISKKLKIKINRNYLIMLISS